MGRYQVAIHGVGRFWSDDPDHCAMLAFLRSRARSFTVVDRATGDRWLYTVADPGDGSYSFNAVYQN